MGKAFPLRQLRACLQKVVSVSTSEKETEGRLKSHYVWRDEQGHKCYWSPGPVRYEYHDVDKLADAHHILFLCPLCFAKNGGSKGTHKVMVTFANRNVPENAGTRDADGKPSRWVVKGTGLDDLVLSPSILLDAKRPADQGCHWHGFVGMAGIAPGHAG